MQKLGMQEGEAIEHPWVTKAIENAQRKVEGHNFDIRKNLLEYDDVSNDQRTVVYEQRDDLMESESVLEYVDDLRDEIIIPPGSMEEQWDIDGLQTELETLSNEVFDVKGWLEEDPNIPEEDISTRIVETLRTRYKEKEALAGEEGLRRFEKYVMLQSLDEHWKEHLAGMDYLRQSVGLRGYAQKNPKQEYKREAFELFQRMLGEYKREVTSVLSRVQIQDAEQVEQVEANRATPTDVTYEHQAMDSALAEETATAEAAPSEANQAIAAAAAARDDAIARRQSVDQQAPTKPFVRGAEKVGRNDRCPCGSGKKFKQCHGKLS